jgi:hypothetical protein
MLKLRWSLYGMSYPFPYSGECDYPTACQNRHHTRPHAQQKWPKMLPQPQRY